MSIAVHGLISFIFALQVSFDQSRIIPVKMHYSGILLRFYRYALESTAVVFSLLFVL